MYNLLHFLFCSAANNVLADDYDYLRDESATRLVDRLDDISRSFPIALELGCYRGHVLKRILKESEDREDIIGGVSELTQTDISQEACNWASKISESQHRLIVRTQIVDEESIPFEGGSYDLVMSSMALHWVNNIPSTLQKIRQVLKPDGAFIGSMLGGSTLQELRYCLYLAEQERKGGFSPHCSPFVQPSDVAGLLQMAGFTLPTVDIDTITVFLIIL